MKKVREIDASGKIREFVVVPKCDTREFVRKVYCPELITTEKPTRIETVNEPRMMITGRAFSRCYHNISQQAESLVARDPRFFEDVGAAPIINSIRPVQADIQCTITKKKIVINFSEPKKLISELPKKPQGVQRGPNLESSNESRNDDNLGRYRGSSRRNCGRKPRKRWDRTSLQLSEE